MPLSFDDLNDTPCFSSCQEKRATDCRAGSSCLKHRIENPANITSIGGAKGVRVNEQADYMTFEKDKMNVRQKILWGFLIYFLVMISVGVAYVLKAVIAIAEYAAQNPSAFAGG